MKPSEFIALSLSQRRELQSIATAKLTALGIEDPFGYDAYVGAEAVAILTLLAENEELKVKMQAENVTLSSALEYKDKLVIEQRSILEDIYMIRYGWDDERNVTLKDMPWHCWQELMNRVEKVLDGYGT